MNIDIQVASEFTRLPSDESLARWATQVLNYVQRPEAELTIRIVDEPEITALNSQYRDKHKPTNVLSFPMDPSSEAEQILLGESDDLLGDIVICAPIVAAEADAQGKSYKAHFAHMVVHGTLHLLGYDHVTETQAAVMEPLEIDILASMQFSNPYEVNDSDER